MENPAMLAVFVSFTFLDFERLFFVFRFLTREKQTFSLFLQRAGRKILFAGQQMLFCCTAKINERPAFLFEKTEKSVSRMAKFSFLRAFVFLKRRENVE